MLEKTEVKTHSALPDGTFLIGTTSHGFFLFDGKSITPWNVAANNLLKEFQINNAIITGKYIIIGTIVRGIFILDFHGNIISNLNTRITFRIILCFHYALT